MSGAAGTPAEMAGPGVERPPSGGGVDGRRRRIGRWLLPACVAAAYFLFCLAVQSFTGAWRADFAAYPDEPSHFVGSAMVQQWLLSGHWLSPVRFASAYYSHYPYFAVGYWPPLFYLVTALDFLLLGVGRIQALLIPAACAAITAWLIFRLLRPSIGAVAAVCAGAVYLSLPASQEWFCAVMVDHMTTCLCIAAGVLLLRYLDQPDYLNGTMLALTSACAVLSKYSAAYVVVLPWAAVVLLRRYSLLRKPSFLIQPIILALLLAPWFRLSRGLMFYGLPAGQLALTVSRVASFVTESFRLFPPVLMVAVILGLLALLVMPRRWREDVAVLALIVAGHLSLLVLSNVTVESRYLLASAVALLVLSLAGWGEALSRVPALLRYAGAAGPSAAVLTAVFLLFYAGRCPRVAPYPIRSIVRTILANPDFANQRVIVPTGLEGPFIAGFVAEEYGRPSVYTVRPRKSLAHTDWFGGNYTPLFSTPEQVFEFLRRNKVEFVIWRENSPAKQEIHDLLLGEMLRRYPMAWHKTGSFTALGERNTSWAIYEQTPLSAAH